MTDPVEPWKHDRAPRNLNPGDLRPRHAPPPWPGQDGIDGAAGGPFSIFLTAADGWAALGLWCLDARYLRGLTTAVQMVSVFAPPAENDTESYAASVANKVGHDALDLSVPATLEALCRAIAHFEEWRPVWTNAEIASGMKLCAARWPSYRAVRIDSQPPAAPVTQTA